MGTPLQLIPQGDTVQWGRGAGGGSTGVPLSQENACPEDLTVGMRLGPYGDPVGWLFSYERGTGVPRS